MKPGDYRNIIGKKSNLKKNLVPDSHFRFTPFCKKFRTITYVTFILIYNTWFCYPKTNKLEKVTRRYLILDDKLPKDIYSQNVWIKGQERRQIPS